MEANTIVEDLLKPRYKVIADYPNSEFKVGEILGQFAMPINKDSFTNIFRKLEWWEDRKPEEMPEYVKQKNGNTKAVYKVRTHFDFQDDKGWGFVADHDGINRYYHAYLPATESEYLAYNQQQSSKK